jgi:hypothetical protein
MPKIIIAKAGKPSAAPCRSEGKITAITAIKRSMTIASRQFHAR